MRVFPSLRSVCCAALLGALVPPLAHSLQGLRASLAPLAPIVPIAPMAMQQDSSTHMHTTEIHGWRSFDILVDGNVEFTDDDRDVKSLSPYGHFRLEEDHWFSSRSYDVKADSAGNLTKTYSIGWSVKALDSDGRAWLARTLPRIIRDTGAGARQRVTRILRQGGAQAVLSEVRSIPSDGSKRSYLEELFSQASLTDAELKDAANLIRKLSSDGDKAQLIIEVDRKYFMRDLRSWLFDAVASITSDGDKRRALSDIARKDGSSVETLVSVARTARRISSDGDKAEMLIEIASQYRANAQLRGAYFAAVNSISSDGDHAHVLSKLLSENAPDNETMIAALQSAERISSDGDKASVLTDAIRHYAEAEGVRRSFFAAVNSIASDGDHHTVLSALSQRQDLGPATLADIAASAARIASDGDKARVLIDLLADNTELIRDAFFTATDTISSDGERSRVLEAVLEKSGTSDTTAIAAIESASHMSSDGDKGNVLLNAARRYSSRAEVQAALRRALDSLNSDSEYRRVMTALNGPRGTK